MEEFEEFDEFEESEPVSKTSEFFRKASSYGKKVLTVLSFAMVVALGYFVATYHATEKPKTRMEILTEELNALNVASVSDAGACARNEARDVRKKEILKSLNNYK